MYQISGLWTGRHVINIDIDQGHTDLHPIHHIAADIGVIDNRELLNQSEILIDQYAKTSIISDENNYIARNLKDNLKLNKDYDVVTEGLF